MSRTPASPPATSAGYSGEVVALLQVLDEPGLDRPPPEQLAGQRAGRRLVDRDRDGKVLNTMALDVLDGQIQTIRSVQNPDKLRHVGPVADAWAVAREVNQARRPKDRPQEPAAPKTRRV